MTTALQLPEIWETCRRILEHAETLSDAEEEKVIERLNIMDFNQAPLSQYVDYSRYLHEDGEE